MKRLGGWWRLWVALSAIWLIVVICVISYQILKGRSQVQAQREATANALRANCVGPIFGQTVDLRAYSGRRLHEIDLGVDLLKPPDVFDTVDAARKFATAGELKSWGMIVLSDQYQNLSQQDREAARQQFFREVVAPKLGDPELIAAGQRYFDRIYGPQAANDFPKQKNTDPIDAMLAARASGKDVEDDTIVEADRLIENCLGAGPDASNANALGGPDYPGLILLAVLVGLAPSLLLLLVGLTVSWVAAGFRHRGSD